MATRKENFIAHLARTIDIYSSLLLAQWWIGLSEHDQTRMAARDNALHPFFLHRPAESVQFCVLELEVYAAGLGELDKIPELDQQLSSSPGLRYEVDRNHNLVYLELDQPTITFREMCAVFSQAFPRSALYRRDSGRAATENKNAAAKCLVI